MKAVKITRISSNDLDEFIEAVLAGPIWVRVSDTLNRWYGTIGKVDPTEAIEAFNANPPTITHGNYNYFLWRHMSLYDSIYIMCGNGKKLKYSADKCDMEWLPDYTGPGVYQYTKDPIDNVGPQYDMMGNEIKLNSFVVTGSGHGGLQIAKIAKLFSEKYGSNYRIRAELEVLLDNYLAKQDKIGDGSKTATVGIDNILVLTETLLEEFMMKRLSA